MTEEELVEKLEAVADELEQVKAEATAVIEAQTAQLMETKALLGDVVLTNSQLQRLNNMLQQQVDELTEQLKGSGNK